MTATVESLGINRLSVEQRIVLVQEIWDSIAADSSTPMLSETQRRELQSRIADDDARPDELIPWEQVKAQALSRIQR